VNRRAVRRPQLGEGPHLRARPPCRGRGRARPPSRRAGEGVELAWGEEGGRARRPGCCAGESKEQVAAGRRREKEKGGGKFCLDGERQCSFALRWDADAKCLSCLHVLLEGVFQCKSTVRVAFLHLHALIGVSLTQATTLIPTHHTMHRCSLSARWNALDEWFLTTPGMGESSRNDHRGQLKKNRVKPSYINKLHKAVRLSWPR
jgi:hypothetical protein